MEGVTVLNEVVHYGISDAILFICTLAVGIGVGIIILNIISPIQRIKIAIAVFLITLGIYGFIENHITYDYTEYQCIISDDIKFNELTDNYEILGHDGDIWKLAKLEEVK